MTESTAIVQKFLEKPEDFPEYLHRTKDFATGMEIYQYVDTISIAASTIKATILYSMQKEWRPEEHEGEQFHDWFVRLTGQDIVTVQNKIMAGDTIRAKCVGPARTFLMIRRNQPPLLDASVRDAGRSKVPDAASSKA